MSVSDMDFQDQIASVLGALLKEATVELTKLFESRYRTSVRTNTTANNNEERTKERSGTSETLVESKKSDRNPPRSIGIQVDEDTSAPIELTLYVEQCSSDWAGDRLNECPAKEGPTDIPRVDANGHGDPGCSSLKEKDVEMVEESSPKPESPSKRTAKYPGTRAANHVSTVSSPQKSPAKQKPLLVQMPGETGDLKGGGKVNYVCPLVLKAEVPAPEPPVQGEPQQACVSTAEGTAYSPSSPSDGAMGPSASLWQRINIKQEADNHLHLKLKLISDDKLVRPCSVQLVDLLSVSESGNRRETCGAGKGGVGGVGTKGKASSPAPKDLRPHQGAHTGHRLCCFTQCGDAVWRLQAVVDHSRDGYACNICGKRFKRRKILRRHDRFHSGEKPYSCSSCSKSFALRKSLRRHERFHTGERPHNCPQCGKSFRLRDNLKAHLRFHSGEKPFICSLCGKCFRISRNLEKHNGSQCIALVPSFRTIAGL